MYENISDFLLLVYIFRGSGVKYGVFLEIYPIFLWVMIFFFCVLGVRWRKYVFSGN